MRLLTQVLLVNLLLIAAAVLAAAIAANPENELRDTGAAGLVLGFALALSVAVNVFLLSRRFRPLEDLTDEMEQVNLSQPWSATSDDRRLGGPGEVQRLERAFRSMLERLEAERRLIASASLEAQERERARVALDLHDEVNQALTGLMLRLEALRTKAPPELSAELAETRSLAGSAMDELLKLARQLRPTALDDLGLEAALAGLVEEVTRQGSAVALFDCEAAAGPLSALPAEAQLVVYRVAQEALSNAVRHSGAEHIRVRLLLVADGGLELRVSDDGSGFDAADPESGLGISGMQERALLVGGRLDVDSRSGEGTRVRLRVPPADEEAES